MFLDIVKSIIFGIIEGITEWLQNDMATDTI